ncbi:MAG: sn-glycerol-3-phosphate ABC transporter ATP-binding protein UgpC [Chloroflexota bacterium]|nr:sn-glycerol-3-phosphate ABC transporter ATP-binding protein UgpC [Chloroflexota bacterium]MDE3192058.1 sn-glycerol-3-phosphate ABC transporter ATP-binding protein UgpC [Chloroflexota bacterium]
MATVELQHVTKRFGDVLAVNDLNLKIKDQEFLVFVGPSGCGKTTALRMVAGLEQQSGGNIYIGDRLVNDVAPKDRDIAMVFQNYALYPHMNVEQNLAFGLKLRHVGKAEIKRRIDGAAQILALGHLLKRRPRELSGGQRQRVAVGRAIVREPAAFLMDEPLSNLDAKLRIQTRAEIQKLHQRIRTTTIYVTHDQVEAMTMGERIAVMHDGILQQLDTPEALYERPANLFVAGFIGSPAMNFFKGKIVGTPDAPLVDVGLFSVAVPSPQRAAASRALGSEVVYGVRPEHMFVRDGSSPEGVTVEAKVEVVEYLGYEEQVYCSLDSTSFNVRLPAQMRTHVGGRIPLTIPKDRGHVFDAKTEQALAA